MFTTEQWLAFLFSSIIISMVDAVIGICLALIVWYHAGNFRYSQIVWVFSAFFFLKSLSRVIKFFFWKEEFLDQIVLLDVFLSCLSVVIFILTLAATRELLKLPRISKLQEEKDILEVKTQVLETRLQHKDVVADTIRAELTQQTALAEKLAAPNTVKEVIEKLEKLKNGGSDDKRSD